MTGEQVMAGKSEGQSEPRLNGCGSPVTLYLTIYSTSTTMRT